MAGVLPAGHLKTKRLTYDANGRQPLGNRRDDQVARKVLNKHITTRKVPNKHITTRKVLNKHITTRLVQYYSSKQHYRASQGHKIVLTCRASISCKCQGFVTPWTKNCKKRNPFRRLPNARNATFGATRTKPSVGERHTRLLHINTHGALPFLATAWWPSKNKPYSGVNRIRVRAEDRENTPQSTL